MAATPAAMITPPVQGAIGCGINATRQPQAQTATATATDRKVIGTS